MAKRTEVRGLIARENGRFAKSLSSDIGMRVLPVESEVDPTIKSLALIRNGLAQQGLGGEGHLFGAESRRHPIGLPVHMTGSEKGTTHAIGLYIPVTADRKLGDAGEIDTRVANAMQSVFDVNAREKLRLPFKDGLIAVNSQRVAHWEEHGLHPTVTTDHSTHVTAEDEAYQRRGNDEMLDRYVGAMLDSVAQLKMFGLKPRDLGDPTEPIKQVGGQTSILVGAFVNVSHQSVGHRVAERDGGRCSMPIARLVKELNLNGRLVRDEEIPKCDRNLVNYYPSVGHTRHRVIVDEVGCDEANHVLPKGAAMVGAVKAALSGLIPEEVFERPERLLLTLGLMNIAELAASNGIDLVGDKERILRTVVRIMPLVDAAVNNVGNLMTADEEHHHGWYHPDESLIRPITSFVDGVNRGTVPVYLNNVPTFSGWRDEHKRRILDGQTYPGYRGDYQESIGLLHVARSMVMMQSVPYWQDETTQISSDLVRLRTREYMHKKIIEGESPIGVSMRELSGDHGTSIANAAKVNELVKEFYAVRKQVSNDMHPNRKGDKGTKLLRDFGLVS